MNARQSTPPPNYRIPADIARSVSDLTSQEAECHRFFTQRRPDLIALVEDAFNIHLDALHIASGHGWKSYSEKAVMLWSFMTFHTARAALLLALTGYFPQVRILERSLADQANLCVLFSARTEYAEKALRRCKVPGSQEILRILDEGLWPGYEILHAFVHARVEAVESYMAPTPPDEMSLTLGPTETTERFDEAIAAISLFLLLAAQTLGFTWEPVRQDQVWWERFKALIDRWRVFFEQQYGPLS